MTDWDRHKEQMLMRQERPQPTPEPKGVAREMERMRESIYQQRYLAHRERKARELSTPSVSEFPALSRRSRRRFQPGVPLRREHKEALLQAVADAPSSCNRGGVSVEWVTSDEAMHNMNVQMVGGKGWIIHASAMMLFWTQMECYQHHTEQMKQTLMAQDSAFAACMVHAKACEIGIASCFVCSNVSPPLHAGNENVFCGALAVGYPVLPDLEPPEKRTWEEVLL